jgi:hypothetical protein
MDLINNNDFILALVKLKKVLTKLESGTQTDRYKATLLEECIEKLEEIA